MNKIEVRVLNPESVMESERMSVCAARLTQSGHSIKSMEDFLRLYDKPYSAATLSNMVTLPHPTLQKFGVINTVVVGASRRFLAQITRHQNEVKFMSASLQYSNYQDDGEFVVPYELLDSPLKDAYLAHCQEDMCLYKSMVASGASNDTAGYMTPEGLRNILIISATPYQWKHMIGQRTCRRNTVETRYVMLLLWEQLFQLSPILFSPETTGPFCMRGCCEEGKMSCGRVMDKRKTPTEILNEDYPKLRSCAIPRLIDTGEAIPA